MKISLHSISYAGIFYEGPALSLEQIIDKAVDFGYEGVEVMAKRPVASPFDFDTDRALRAREYAQKKDIELVFLAGYLDFAKPDAVDREKELCFGRESIRLAKDLGCPYVRVYAGGERIHEGVPVWDQWNWSVDCTKELVPVAQEAGVRLALEVHTGVCQTADALTDMVEQIGADDLDVCLDPPLLAIRHEDVAGAARSLGKHIVHGHLVDFVRRAPVITYHAMPGLGVRETERIEQVPLGQGEVDIEGFVGALAEVGYERYLSVEVCTPFHVHHRRPKMEDVDKLVQSGVAYMKGLKKKHFSR